MEISRLIFSKETKEKINKPISPQHKGKLRWEKLKEAEENGVLQKAKKRVDVGRIVGIENYQTSYSWVSGLISKGAIIERIAGFEDGAVVFEYSLGKELNYSSGRSSAKKKQAEQQQYKAEKLSTAKISKRKQGELRWDKLMENVIDGKLVGCINRKDIIKLVGYPKKEHHSGYSWVTNMITRGHLIEKRVNTDSNGLAVFEYTIGSQPNYRLRTGSMAKKRGAIEFSKEAKPVEEPKIAEPTVLSRVNQDKPSVVITYGELRIEFNDTNADVIKDAIVMLIDKVKE